MSFVSRRYNNKCITNELRAHKQHDHRICFRIEHTNLEHNGYLPDVNKA